MANPNPGRNRQKRKRSSGISRKPKGGNKKRSSFDYDAAREELGIPNANSQQITSHAMESGSNPRAPRSPLKKEIKRQLKQKEEEVKTLNTQVKTLQTGTNRLGTKVSSLQQQVRQLSHDLRQEKHKSRLAMEKLLHDAELTIGEANNVRIELDAKMSAVELAVEKEREKTNKKVNEERQFMAKSMSACESISLNNIIASLSNCFHLSLRSETKAEARTRQSSVGTRCGVTENERATRKEDTTMEELVDGRPRANCQ